MRKWIKCIPPKKVQEEFGNVYQGIWMPQMDRYWESDDGWSVMSRLLKTKWGQVEHVTIKAMVGGMWSGDVPWALKQEIIFINYIKCAGLRPDVRRRTFGPIFKTIKKRCYYLPFFYRGCSSYYFTIQ